MGVDVDVVSQQVRFRPVHILCVLFNTYTRTHTHTHRARVSGRDTSPVALSFFDGSFALPSLSLLRFSAGPPKYNTIISFLFISFRFAFQAKYNSQAHAPKER